MTLPRVSLTLAGIALLALGAAFVVLPEDLVRFARVSADRPAAVIEIQARYGGLHVGLGLFFLVSSFRIRWVRAALGAQILVFTGLAGGRLIGMLMAPVSSRINLVYFALECTGALIGFFAFRRAKFILQNTRTPTI